MATLRKRWNEAGTSWWRELNWREAGRQYRRSLGQIPKKEAGIVLQSKQLELSSGKRILPTGLMNAGPPVLGLLGGLP